MLRDDSSEGSTPYGHLTIQRLSCLFEVLIYILALPTLNKDQKNHF